MNVVKILEWLMTSHNILTSAVLLFFSISLLFIIVRGASR